jgi:hypothetical protein
VTKHVAGADYDTEPWELYHLRPTLRVPTTSPARARAARRPPELWWAEAERHGVLPLDDRTIELFGARFRDRSPAPGRPALRLPAADVAAPGQAAAAIAGRSFDLTATSPGRPATRACCSPPAPRTAGLSLFVQDDRLVLDYNAFGDHTILESDVPCPTAT